MSDPIIIINPVPPAYLIDYGADSGVTYASTGVPVLFEVLNVDPSKNYQWYLTPLIGIGTKIVCTGTKYTLENPEDGDKVHVSSSECCGSCSVIKIVNNFDDASVLNVGTLRYRTTSGNTSCVEMSMKTGVSDYSWVKIKETDSW